MSEPTGKIVVGLGEVLWDCFPDKRRPGGAPSNVAFHAQQLGHKGVVCSRVGTDGLGDELLAYLAERGLDTGYIQRDAERPTSRVTVDVSDTGAPDYVIHKNVAWDHLEFNGKLERLMHDAAAVCFGTLAQRTPESRETIHRALDAATDALIVYDVNLRKDCYEADWVERSMKHADVVKLNRDEVGVLARLLDVPNADPFGFAEAMRERFDVETLCVTRADAGCLLIRPDDVVDVPGVAVKVADAVGAGDAFTAGLVSALLWGWSQAAAAKFANRVGGLVASRDGAMPDLRDQFAALVKQHDQSGTM